MKRRYFTVIIAGAVFLLALILTVYPIISELYNQRHQSTIHDLCLHHRVGKRLPQISNGHLIAYLQRRDIQKIRGTVPSTMPGNDAVGICSPNGQAGGCHLRRAVCHVPCRCPQINRHRQIQLGDRQHSKHFAV